MADLLDEESSDSAADTIRQNAFWIDSWDGALAALSRYPWPRLSRLIVHSDFANAILAAVTAYEGIKTDVVDRWRDVISSTR